MRRCSSKPAGEHMNNSEWCSAVIGPGANSSWGTGNAAGAPCSGWMQVCTVPAHAC